MVRATPQGWYLVTQPDHAALAAELARHWTFEGLPGDDDPEFLAAVSAHDAGWCEVDAAPRLHPDGSPVSFMEWPLVEAVSIWRRSIADAGALGATARYVVGRHFYLLGRNARSRPLQTGERQVLDAFLAEWETVPHSPHQAHLTALLQVCDLVSLHLLTGGRMNTALLERLGIASAFQPECNRLGLEPYPFDATLSLRCPARFLPRGGRLPEPASEMCFTVACSRDFPIPASQP